MINLSVRAYNIKHNRPLSFGFVWVAASALSLLASACGTSGANDPGQLAIENDAAEEPPMSTDGGSGEDRSQEASTACAQGDTRECIGPGACRGGQFCETGGIWFQCECGGGGSTGADAGAAHDASADLHDGGATAMDANADSSTLDGSNEGASQSLRCDPWRDQPDAGCLVGRCKSITCYDGVDTCDAQTGACATNEACSTYQSDCTNVHQDFTDGFTVADGGYPRRRRLNQMDALWIHTMKSAELLSIEAYVETASPVDWIVYELVPDAHGIDDAGKPYFIAMHFTKVFEKMTVGTRHGDIASGSGDISLALKSDTDYLIGLYLEDGAILVEDVGYLTVGDATTFSFGRVAQPCTSDSMALGAAPPLATDWANGPQCVDPLNVPSLRLTTRQ